MFNVRPDLSWLGYRLALPGEEEGPGFRVRPPKEEVPGLHNFKPPQEEAPGLHNFKPPKEAVPGFRMKADGSVRQAYPDPGGRPFDPLDRPGPGVNDLTPVADKPPWGGWGMSPYPEDNDNEPPNMWPTPICDRANFLCQQFGRGAAPDRYARWVYDCSNHYGLCRIYEGDPNRIGRLGDRVEFPDGSAVIFRRGYPPRYVPSPRL